MHLNYDDQGTVIIQIVLCMSNKLVYRQSSLEIEEKDEN